MLINFDLIGHECHELLDEQGVALAGREDALPHWTGRHLGREVVEQCGRVGDIQGVEADQAGAGSGEPVRAGLLELGTRDGDEEDRTPTEREDVLQDVRATPAPPTGGRR